LAAFVAVVLQGVLGGLRVVLLKGELGIFHAALAQLFFVLICLLALFTSPWWWKATSKCEGAARVGIDFRVRFWFIAAASLIFVQLILGPPCAISTPDSRSLIFPSLRQAVACDGSEIGQILQSPTDRSDNCKPDTAFQIGLHMAHRSLGFAIFACVSAAAVVARRRLEAKMGSSGLRCFGTGCLHSRLGLGAATIWSNKAADVATAHVMVGAVSLVLGAIACIISARTARFAGGLSSSSDLAGRKPLVLLWDL